MPFKSEKIKIEGTKFDRRIKLTQEQKDQIADLKGKISRIACANQRNKQLRQERGGSKQYYDRVKWAEQMKEHRDYKQDLYLEGKIRLTTESL